MHSYCSNNAVTVLNVAKSLKIQSTMNFKNLKFSRISSASQPAVRPGSASATALEFLYNKGIHFGFAKLVPKNIRGLQSISIALFCFLERFCRGTKLCIVQVPIFIRCIVTKCLLNLFV